MNDNTPEQPTDTTGDGSSGPPRGAPRLALVRGEALTELPTDLYIPPHALEVFLEAFEGPLDLLLYLIRRQNLDILDIRVAEITAQYMSYIELMQSMQFELAGDYLVMAAMLAEIKSRMLLPRPVDADDEEADPRAEADTAPAGVRAAQIGGGATRRVAAGGARHVSRSGSAPGARA